MSRILISNKREPYKIEPQKNNIWICQCGLSRNKPFCDGSHTRTNAEDITETYIYTTLTQKRLNIAHFSRSEVEKLRQRSDDEIFEHDNIKVERVRYTSEKHKYVVNIRQQRSKDTPIDILDHWSDIYLYKKAEIYCATMRVTQARDGFLDIEDYYPDFLKTPKLRCLIGSANRLYKLSDSPCATEDIFLFIREVWKDQYEDGMRIDLINATIPMTRYYKAIGYKSIGEEFIHPRTKKNSIAMIYIVIVKT